MNEKSLNRKAFEPTTSQSVTLTTRPLLLALQNGSFNIFTNETKKNYVKKFRNKTKKNYEKICDGSIIKITVSNHK
jgi:hypothetical protein